MNPLVFIQNTGAVSDGASGGNPMSVTDGKIAVINAATGAEHSMDDTLMPASFYLVRGDDVQPIISPVIEKANVVNAEYLAYTAPVKKVVEITSIPAGSTGGDTYTVKVVNLKTDTEPFTRDNYEIVVAASQSDEDSIYALIKFNKADSNRFVDFGTNKIYTGVIEGLNVDGVFIVTVTDGETGVSTSYSEAATGVLDTDGASFVTNHAAALLADFGIVVTYTAGSDTLTFTGSVASGDFTIVDASTGTDAAITVSAATEATTLYIRSAEVEDNFQVFLNDTTGSGISVATATVSSAWKEGSGSYAQILALENQSFGRRSNQLRETPQPLLPENFADSSKNYDVWTFLVKTNQDGQSPVKGHQYYQVVIANGTDVTGDWNTFLTTS